MITPSHHGFRRALAAFVLPCLVWIASTVLVRTAASQVTAPNTKPEVFEKNDPYLDATDAALAHAGYVSRGPFRWCEGVVNFEIDKVIDRRVLWIETAHFKVGSTLESYRLGADKLESKLVTAELARLEKKLEHVSSSRTKLDPWLRLHLTAQRLEDTFAEFVKTFAIDEARFNPRPGSAEAATPDMGRGPYLGMPLKFTVLACETKAELAKYLDHYVKRTTECSIHEQLPGGSLFLGVSAEGLRNFGYEFDVALRCLLAYDTTITLVDAFRGSYSTPYWFKQGLAHVASRKVDERWNVFASGQRRLKDDETWRFEPRLSALVSSGFAAPWKDMLAWKRWEDVDANGHVLSWSRVSYLLAQRDADLNALLMAFTDPLAGATEDERAKSAAERTPAILKKVFGRDVLELDDAWRAFVVKTYPKK